MVKVITAPKPSTNQLFFNQLSTVRGDSIIKCTTSGCEAIDYAGAAGAGHALLDDGDPNKKSLILADGRGRYEDFTSKLTTKKEYLYFILNSDTSKIIACNEEEGCKIENSNTTPGHGYIDATAEPYTRIISCENRGGTVTCTSDDLASDSRLSSNDFFYINGKETNKIISCLKSTHVCANNEGSTANGHAYVSEILTGADDEKKTIITCSIGKGCTTKTLGSELENENKYFICGHDITYLIECTSEGCAMESNKRTSGTEKDGSSDERIIICSEYGCISST
eukprot:jgi/Orpsp1_1/1181085/evm.model.c7180000075798.1